MKTLMHESMQDWKDIFNTITDMITIHDKDFNIIHANTAAEKILKLPSFDITKVKCYKYYHGRNCPPKGCPSCKCLKTGIPATFELFEPYLNMTIEIRAIPRFNVKKQITGVIHIVRDITQRKQSEEQLKNSREQLSNLTAYLLSVREEERRRIAREIHDELAQVLTALKMDLFWLSKKLPENQKLLYEKTKSMSELVDTTIGKVQKISSELRPGLLDDLGLQAAMEWQAGEFQNRTGIKCEIIFNSKSNKLDQERSTAIFRIFQETLTNVARHANATRVRVRLKENAGNLLMEVRDNGKGITEEQMSSPKSFGLIGIRERIHFFGGEIKMSGVQDKGTAVTVSIPLNKLKEKSDDKNSYS